MASVEQHCDTLVEKEEEKVKHEQVKMSSSTHTGVSVNVSAQMQSTVNATVLSGNTISGPVTINYNTAGNETQKISETEMAEKQDMILKNFLETHKCTMKSKAECIFEGQEENEADLKAVYTEIFITEGDMQDVNRQHEILNIDYAFNNKVPQDKPIKCNDIFTELRKKNLNKIVLTKGIAGIGKTISVHKFILDWAEGKANQDVDCVFLLLFREINLMVKDLTLHELLLEFYPELKDMEKTKLYNECNLAFIFDGLDESRLALEFTSIPPTRDPVESKSSVDVLFMNLVKGNLLPSALVWVTSRPATANQIPRQYVGLFTEVRGFTDQHKEEYFRKRITDETVASRIISHIKTSRSLYIMCHIPVFCWITATVLQDILIENSAENISTTLTEMYIHFMLIQMNIKNQKYEEQGEIECSKHLQSNREMILKLAKLAFEKLKDKTFVFEEKDLKACGIDVSKDTEFTGMIAEILQKKNVFYYKKVFSFVHLSVQEFLAAVHVFICYLNKNMQELQFFFDEPEESITLQELLQKAIAKAILSKGGHLDLFLRFLMGITLESSQDLLQGLITHTEDTTESIKKTTKYIKQVQDGYTISDEASVNLFYCLLELKDHSLYEEIQSYISSNEHQERKLSSSKCTVLTYIMLMSEKVLDEFNPRRFTSSQENYQRFVPVVRCCRKALFDSCGLDKTCWETVSSALQSSDSHLTELDLSSNDLTDSGVKLLSDGLKKNCNMEILRLSGCMVTKEGCGYLSSALSSNPSHLRMLDLSYNHPGDSGVKLLNHPNCTLDKNMDNGGESRITAGLKKYACFLTLDPNTANNNLSMSEENRKVTYKDKGQSYPDHPERFDVYQILCRESLTGRCYWEAEWSGAEAVISVTYKGIGRKGRRRDCMLGRNQISWSLLCTEAKFTMRHNYSSVDISVPSLSSNRVGVYVDMSAGILSFYSVSDTHTLTHLHTLNTAFTEPLYAGFGVYDFNSVSLCDVSSLCKEPPVRN
ncbi:NACHT, LRR and PYD domains-containing protein 13-like isoform X3 [Carassius auratus]|uniref:NACHT, LRR and PYD domains-containing protein 13-like isoform X3 n=1 Tax=Carassius auratus TaxID=7957 RepID=A0A6P6JZM7_CARAU|nr:NACHT, LRR and PYD domains-containing protein 13-like isoform X3 [Carassius auratus]